MLTTDSEFGSWHVDEASERSGFAGEGRLRDELRKVTRPGIDSSWRDGDKSPTRQRPASATVRVPYMPSHITAGRIRSRPRPQSAAPSYMRATFSRNSAVPALALGSKLRFLRRLRTGSGRVGAAGSASYVLDEGACGRYGGRRRDVGGGSEVPRQRQCFGVRTVTQGIIAYGTGAGGSNVRATYRSRARPASAPVRFFALRSTSAPGQQQQPQHEKRYSETLDKARRPSAYRRPKRTRSDLGNSKRTESSNKITYNPASIQLRGTCSANLADWVPVAGRSSAAAKVVLATTARTMTNLRCKTEQTWSDGNSDRGWYGERRKSSETRQSEGGSENAAAIPAAVVAAGASQRRAYYGMPSTIRETTHQSQSGTQREQTHIPCDCGIANGDDKWVGFLEQKNRTANAKTGDNRLVLRGGGSPRGLAINPSPWGAVLQEREIRRQNCCSSGVNGRNRPSSARLCYRRAADEALSASTRRCHDRNWARPRSAHAASQSQTYLIAAASVRGGGECVSRRDEMADRSGETASKVRAGKTISHTMCSSLEGWSPAVKAARQEKVGVAANEIPRTDAFSRQNENGMFDGRQCSQRHEVDRCALDEELIVVATTAETPLGTGQSGSRTAGKMLDMHEAMGLKHKIGMPVAPAFWPRIVSGPAMTKAAPDTATSATTAIPATTLKIVRQQSPNTRLRSQGSLGCSLPRGSHRGRSCLPLRNADPNVSGRSLSWGLYGSALVPAGTGISPPEAWANTRTTAPPTDSTQVGRAGIGRETQGNQNAINLRKKKQNLGHPISVALITSSPGKEMEVRAWAGKVVGVGGWGTM